MRNISNTCAKEIRNAIFQKEIYAHFWKEVRKVIQHHMRILNENTTKTCPFWSVLNTIFLCITKVANKEMISYNYKTRLQQYDFIVWHWHQGSKTDEYKQPWVVANVRHKTMVHAAMMEAIDVATNKYIWQSKDKPRWYCGLVAGHPQRIGGQPWTIWTAPFSSSMVMHDIPVKSKWSKRF